MLYFLRKIGEKNGIKILVFIKKIGGFYFYFF